MLPVSLRTAVLAGVALAVTAASSSVGYKLGRAAGDREVAKMYRAGIEVVRKRDESIARNLEVYREELADLRNRPPKRVLYCPAARLPTTPGGTDDAGPGSADPVDLGPLLREALDELVRCNALRATLK